MVAIKITCHFWNSFSLIFHVSTQSISSRRRSSWYTNSLKLYLGTFSNLPQRGFKFPPSKHCPLLYYCFLRCTNAQSCPSLQSPGLFAHQAPLSIGFSRQEYWSGLPFPSPEDLPNKRLKLGLPHRGQILYCLSYLGSPISNNSRYNLLNVLFSSLQLLSRVRLFATPWIAACQASLSITISRSSFKLTSIESVIPSSHLIFYCSLFLLPLIPPSIRVFSNESTLHMRWPKYWSFSFIIIPSKEHPGLISFRMDCLDLLAICG